MPNLWCACCEEYRQVMACEGALGSAVVCIAPCKLTGSGWVLGLKWSA
jgi:hypothetical protein